jgi:hypothetical protein
VFVSSAADSRTRWVPTAFSGSGMAIIFGAPIVEIQWRFEALIVRDLPSMPAFVKAFSVVRVVCGQIGVTSRGRPTLFATLHARPCCRIPQAVHPVGLRIHPMCPQISNVVRRTRRNLMRHVVRLTLCNTRRTSVWRYRLRSHVSSLPVNGLLVHRQLSRTSRPSSTTRSIVRVCPPTSPSLRAP